MVTPANGVRGRVGLILSLPPIWFRVGAFGDDRGGQTSAGAGPSPDLAELSYEELTTIQVDTSYGVSKREQVVTEAPSAVSIVTKDVMGSELASGLRSANPRLRVLYSSRYSPELAGKDSSPVDGRSFRPKTYDTGELARFVRDVMDRPAGDDGISPTLA